MADVTSGRRDNASMMRPMLKLLKPAVERFVSLESDDSGASLQVQSDTIRIQIKVGQPSGHDFTVSSQRMDQLIALVGANCLQLQEKGYLIVQSSSPQASPRTTHLRGNEQIRHLCPIDSGLAQIQTSAEYSESANHQPIESIERFINGPWASEPCQTSLRIMKQQDCIGSLEGFWSEDCAGEIQITGISGGFAPIDRQPISSFKACILQDGHPRFWVFIPRHSAQILQKRLSDHQKLTVNCSHCISHRQIVCSAAQLDRWDIPYSLVKQSPGEIVLVQPLTYYYSYDLGPNVVESIAMPTYHTTLMEESDCQYCEDCALIAGVNIASDIPQGSTVDPSLVNLIQSGSIRASHPSYSAWSVDATEAGTQLRQDCEPLFTQNASLPEVADLLPSTEISSISSQSQAGSVTTPSADEFGSEGSVGNHDQSPTGDDQYSSSDESAESHPKSSQEIPATTKDGSHDVEHEHASPSATVSALSSSQTCEARDQCAGIGPDHASPNSGLKFPAALSTTGKRSYTSAPKGKDRSSLLTPEDDLRRRLPQEWALHQQGTGWPAELYVLASRIAHTSVLKEIRDLRLEHKTGRYQELYNHAVFAQQLTDMTVIPKNLLRFDAAEKYDELLEEEKENDELEAENKEAKARDPNVKLKSGPQRPRRARERLAEHLLPSYDQGVLGPDDTIERIMVYRKAGKKLHILWEVAGIPPLMIPGPKGFKDVSTTAQRYSYTTLENADLQKVAEIFRDLRPEWPQANSNYYLREGQLRIDESNSNEELANYWLCDQNLLDLFGPSLGDSSP